MLQLLGSVIYDMVGLDSSKPAIILQVRKGCSIYFEKDTADHWYEVVKGTVRTCRYSPDGNRQLTAFFFPGEVFGLEAGRYRECAETVTAVTLRQFERGVRDAPGEPLQRALEEAQRRVFLLSRKTAAERVAAFLLDAASRGGDENGVDLPMSRADIADHLGLNMHTVSRTISGFARRGVIAMDGPQHLERAHVERLRAIAGESPATGGSS